MGRGKASALIFGSPFETNVLGTRSRSHTRPRPATASVGSLASRAKRRVDELEATLEAAPVNQSMDPINVKMSEDIRQLQIGMLKIVATDPGALWDAGDLRRRARREYGQGLQGDTTSFALGHLMDDGYLQLVDRAQLRMIL